MSNRLNRNMPLWSAIALALTVAMTTIATPLAAALSDTSMHEAEKELAALTQEEMELAEADYWDDPLYADIDDPELLDELLIMEEEEMLRIEGEIKEDPSVVEEIVNENQDDDAIVVTDEEVEDIFAREFGYGVDAGPYRLRIGDQLYISIYGEAGTGRTALVDHTGHINYLLIGRFFVLGKTIDQIRAEMNEAIKTYFKHAFVAVTPIQFGSQHYTILGEVEVPGKKVLGGKTTLLEAIAHSSGLREGSFRTQTIDFADLGHSFLARNGEYIPVDFEKLILEGDMSEDIELVNGDYVYIPSVLYREIHILGEVQQPTTIGYINTVSLVEAIAQARGLSERASPRVVVVRGSLADPETYHIDLNLILRGLEPDFMLQPGDIVYAPVRKFQNLRDIVKLALRAFVGAASSAAGQSVFEDWHPDAANSATSEPAFFFGF